MSMRRYFDFSKTQFLMTQELLYALRKDFGCYLKEKIVNKNGNSETVQLSLVDPAHTKSFSDRLFEEEWKPSKHSPSFNWLITFSFSNVSFFDSLIESLKNSKMIPYFSLACIKSREGEIRCFSYIEVTKLSRTSAIKKMFLSHFPGEEIITIKNCCPRKKGYKSSDVFEQQKYILARFPTEDKITDTVFSFGQARDSSRRFFN